MLTSFMQLSKAQILLSSFMGVSGDEMAGQHHRCNEREFGQTLGVGEGKACCDSWGRKESDMIERLK